MPFFSIALPVHNGAAYLRAALDSVLAQRFRDFELVVSENSSTDATADILREYAARDWRIRVHGTERLLPQAENTNRVVDLCDGEWIKLLCHDDLLAPDCLSGIAELIQRAEHPRLGLIGNAERWLYTTGHMQQNPWTFTEKDVRVWPGRDYLRGLMSGERTTGLPSLTTATIRAEAWRQSGPFDSRFVHFDSFLWARLLLDWDYGFIPRALTTNRIHHGQVAVEAHASLRTVRDMRQFWKEFVAAHGATLRLGPMARLRMRLLPVNSAATLIAMRLLANQFGSAITLVANTPVSWWPFLPPLVLRSYRRERARALELAGHVPRSEMFPG